MTAAARRRCDWANSAPDYAEYHDREWGVAVRTDRELFERLSLEGFQSGLAWLTVLRKRDALRAAFADFNPVAVAAFTEADVKRLLADAGIIRHRGKIAAVVGNAQALLRQWDAHGQSWLTEQFLAAAPTEASLAAQGFRRPPRSLADLPAQSQETGQLARELKRVGFRFVGPTTLYAACQATGFVTDHLVECFRFETAAGDAAAQTVAGGA